MPSIPRTRTLTSRTPSPSDISVGFVSLGCAKNLVDSQVMAGSLLSAGITLAPSPEEADVIVVNTCSFIEDARKESVDAILSACEFKNTGPCRAVVVAGCLPQRYATDLADDLPEVDAFIGLDGLEDVADVVKRLGGGESGIHRVPAVAEGLFEPKIPALVFTGGPFAYLKIAEGCNHGCTFCAIPAIRGRYRSRTVTAVANEAEQLLASGIRELCLISQDITAYGRDLDDGTDLPGLLRVLGGVGGDYWIRLLYGHPSGVDDRLLAAMAEIPQVCPYLDIPIQHSHPEILRAMGRGRTVEQVAGLTGRVRQALPGAAVRTTCLVGFPGETEEHFSHLLRFAGENRFDHLGVFVYSPEEGTPAMGMAAGPDRTVAEGRRERLMLAQKEIVIAANRALIGSEADILLERRHPEHDNTIVGRSARQAPEVDSVTLVQGVPADGGPGDFVRVKYTEERDYDMTADYLERF